MSHHDSTYSGWTNKPTWLAHLWLTNDYVLYHAGHEVVQAVDDPETAIRDFVEDVFCDTVFEEARLVSDLLGWALAIVGWREVAEE